MALLRLPPANDTGLRPAAPAALLPAPKAFAPPFVREKRCEDAACCLGTLAAWLCCGLLEGAPDGLGLAAGALVLLSDESLDFSPEERGRAAIVKSSSSLSSSATSAQRAAILYHEWRGGGCVLCGSGTGATGSSRYTRVLGYPSTPMYAQFE